MTEMVCGFLLSPDKENVVLIKRPEGKSFAGLLNGVGGHIEPGETPSVAMTREFFEETGVSIAKWNHKLSFYPKDKGGKVYTVHVFCAESSLYDQVKTQDEGDVVVLPIMRIFSPMLRAYNNINVIPNVPNLIHFCLYN